MPRSSSLTWATGKSSQKLVKKKEIKKNLKHFFFNWEAVFSGSFHWVFLWFLTLDQELQVLFGSVFIKPSLT